MKKILLVALIAMAAWCAPAQAAVCVNGTIKYPNGDRLHMWMGGGTLFSRVDLADPKQGAGPWLAEFYWTRQNPWGKANWRPLGSDSQRTFVATRSVIFGLEFYGIKTGYFAVRITHTVIVGVHRKGTKIISGWCRL